MSSELEKRRRTYVRLIGQIEKALNRALEEEHALRGLTQQEMADLLEKSKSFISRKMNGTSNMTLETLADLAFALDRAIEVSLRSRHQNPGSNAPVSKEMSVPIVISTHAGTASPVAPQKILAGA